MIQEEKYIAFCKCKGCQKGAVLSESKLSYLSLTYHHNRQWLELQAARFKYVCPCGDANTPEFYFMDEKGAVIEIAAFFDKLALTAKEDFRFNNLRKAVRLAVQFKGRLCYSMQHGFVCWTSRFTNPTIDLEIVQDFKNYTGVLTKYKTLSI